MSCFRSCLNVALLLIFFPTFKQNKKIGQRQKSYTQKQQKQKNSCIAFCSMNNTLSSDQHGLLVFINLMTFTRCPQSPVHTQESGSPWAS